MGRNYLFLPFIPTLGAQFLRYAIKYQIIVFNKILLPQKYLSDILMEYWETSMYNTLNNIITQEPNETQASLSKIFIVEFKRDNINAGG